MFGKTYSLWEKKTIVLPNLNEKKILPLLALYAVTQFYIYVYMYHGTLYINACSLDKGIALSNQMIYTTKYFHTEEMVFVFRMCCCYIYVYMYNIFRDGAKAL